MTFRTVALGVSSALALALGAATAADAAVIDFHLPPGQADLGSQYSQDGFTFTSSIQAPFAYFNWVAYGSPGASADPDGDIVQNYSSAVNTITQDNGNPFSFQSIGLAPVYNDGSGGSVQFTFNYAGGGSSSQTVTMDNGVYGLQHFMFNESNLASVQFQSVSTYGNWLQFDEVGVNGVGGVPEPATWTMLLLGFFGLGAMLRGRGGRRAAGMIAA